MHNKIKFLLLGAIASVFLTGCEADKAKKPAISVPIQVYTEIKVLTGQITDSKGAVSAGTLNVYDRQGKQVASSTLKNSAHFKVSIPAGTELPIVLRITSQKNNEKLVAVIISKAVSKYDISTLTTKIARQAKALGGYSYANMVMAADNTVGVPDANKTSTGFKGDPTKQYGGWH